MDNTFLDKYISAASYVFGKDANGGWSVLCGKRSGNDPRFCGGLYNVPVGMREFGESPVENAHRECYEETGIDFPINLFKFVGEDEWARGKYGANFLVVINDISEYVIGNGDWENEKFQWVPISFINKLKWAYNMDKTISIIYNRHIMKQKINESEYVLPYTIGTFSSSSEAQYVLNAVREKFGFSKYDSGIDGTTVKVEIERNGNDDSYMYDMQRALDKFVRSINKQNNLVAENRNMKNNFIELTEGQLVSLINESINKLLSENYPAGAEYDSDAPWNAPDEPDVDDQIQEQVDEEINSLSDEFSEWYFGEYSDEGCQSDEDYDAILRQAGSDENVRSEYYDYRYESIKEDILDNYQYYYDDDDYDDDDRLDESNAPWYSDEAIENGVRKFAKYLANGFRRMGEKFIAGLDPEIRQAWDDGKNGRPCAKKGLTAATIAYKMARDVYDEEATFDNQ